MRIIPVIDLMGTTVVHAVAGDRSSYRPIQSKLTCDCTPESIGRALSTEFRAQTVYVADLDAIGGAEPLWETYGQLADCGLELWLDAGISSPERAAQFCTVPTGAHRSVVRWIIGLESITSPETLRQTADTIGTDRCIFSLDLRHGTPLTQADAWSGFSAVEIARVAVESGVCTIIVLDLAQVGTGQGVGTISLCHQLRARWPEITLVAGGGVRDLGDLLELNESGCDAALVASALHDGRLTREMLTEAGHTL